VYIPAVKNLISASGNGSVFGGVMRPYLKHDLPFTTITIAYQGTTLEMTDVLRDTGSA
jgi:hypothetical protein